VFTLRRTLGAVVPSGPQAAGALAPGAGVLAVAGIADPQRFVEDARAAGWVLTGALLFRDHQPYSRRDLQRVWEEAGRTGAGAVLTTEKDFVRMLPSRPFPLPVGYLPLTMEPEPGFSQWLEASLRAARDITVD
jgi:tetraacyldisaccharide 4'-kinase